MNRFSQFFALVVIFAGASLSPVSACGTVKCSTPDIVISAPDSTK